MNLKAISRQLYLIIIYAFACSANLFAGDVTFVPRITLSEIYTDNVTLSENNPQAEYITQVNPGFNLIMDGSRFDATIDYNMQNLLYAKDSNRNQTFHQFTGTSTTQLIRQALFFDLNASRFQQVTDPERPTNNNNIAINTNRSDVTSVSASPYWRQNLGQYLSTNVRYTYSYVNFDDPPLVDSKSDTLTATLTSPVSQTGVTWGSNYYKSKIDFDARRDVEFERYSIDLGYRFSPQTRIYAQYGDEDNNFASQSNIDGTFWSAGIDWQPGAQDRISLTYGERFFGKTSSFSWNHTAARFNLSTSYLEELVTVNQTISQNINNPNAQQNTNLNTTSQVFIRKLGQAGISYNISKTTIAFNYSDDLREFLNTGTSIRQQFGTMSILLQSSASLRYRFAHAYSEIQTVNTGFKSYENRTSFGVNIQLSQNTSLNPSLGYNTRNTTDSVTQYDANIVSLSLTTNFR